MNCTLVSVSQNVPLDLSDVLDDNDEVVELLRDMSTYSGRQKVSISSYSDCVLDAVLYIDVRFTVDKSWVKGDNDRAVLEKELSGDFILLQTCLIEVFLGDNVST